MEEGNLGYSLVTFDQGSVSWHFLEPQIVVVSSPVDEKLLTEAKMESLVEAPLRVRAWVWGKAPVAFRFQPGWMEGYLYLNRRQEELYGRARRRNQPLRDGMHDPTVTAEDEAHRKVTDAVRIIDGRNSYSQRNREHTDVDNVLEPWNDRGLWGTQLGANKNGLKW